MVRCNVQITPRRVRDSTRNPVIAGAMLEKKTRKAKTFIMDGDETSFAHEEERIVSGITSNRKVASAVRIMERR